MNRLYCVTVFNHRQNQYEAVLVTVRETQTITDAENEVKEGYGSEWKIHGSTFVCSTPDDVHLIAR